MNDRGRPSGSPLRWDTWTDRVGARHCLALIRRRPAAPTAPRHCLANCLAMNERVGMNGRGRPSGSPLRWDTWSFWPDPWGRGTASPSSGDAPRRPPSRGMPRELFVPAMNERVGMNDRGRPSGSPLRWDTWSFWPDRVGARHCLALIRRRPAAPTIPRHASRIVCPSHERARWHEWPRATQWVAPTLGHMELLAGPRGGEALPRPYPATPRVAHHPEALPRELFVPAMNERVGMNGRGRPSGSPLRWDTWSFWPDRVGARHCLALIRRRPAAPTIPRHASRIVCPSHERARWHE